MADPASTMPDITPDASAKQPVAKPGDPVCGRCGYLLVGLGNIGQCPECGGKLIDVLVRSKGELREGRRWHTNATLLGWPLMAIAFGPHKEERIGIAKGWIALGDIAIGGVAVGGAWSVGLVTVGGAGSLGVISAFGGGLAFGGVTSLAGGMALGTGLTVGGGAAAGGIAVAGGAAAGFVSSATVSAGYYARGVVVTGEFLVASRRTDPEAREVFTTLAPFIGSRGLPMRAAGTVISIGFGAALLISLLALILSRRPRPAP
jgi:hypothetical protein